jgi:hypothetical protein
MERFIEIYLVVGFLLGISLLGWALVSSTRRYGFRDMARRAARGYVHGLHVSRRLRWTAWTFLVTTPLIAAWAILHGNWDPLSAIFLALLWLIYFALLRWQLREIR